MEEKIVLTDDTGKEEAFSIVEETQFQGKHYILVENAKQEVLILRDESEPTDDYANYALLKDEREEEALLQIFEELMNTEE